MEAFDEVFDEKADTNNVTDGAECDGHLVLIVLDLCCEVVKKIEYEE